MNSQLNQMIAREQHGDLARSVDRHLLRRVDMHLARSVDEHRAAPIATPATSRNPAFVQADRPVSWWQLRRRLRPT